MKGPEWITLFWVFIWIPGENHFGAALSLRSDCFCDHINSTFWILELDPFYFESQRKWAFIERRNPM